MAITFPLLSLASAGRYFTASVIGINHILSAVYQQLFTSEDWSSIFMRTESRQAALETFTSDNLTVGKAKQSVSDIISARQCLPKIDSSTLWGTTGSIRNPKLSHWKMRSPWQRNSTKSKKISVQNSMLWPARHVLVEECFSRKSRFKHCEYLNRLGSHSN